MVFFGDVVYCVLFMSGMGIIGVFVGVYVLVGELSWLLGNVEIVLVNYEKILWFFVDVV